jgi:hypothetical protein
MALQQIPAATVSAGNVWEYYLPGANTTAYSYGAPGGISKANGYWFITTQQGFILYSSDAKTWTRWASTATEAVVGLAGVIYGNGTYVIYGDSGYLFSATTLGGTLTSRTSQFAGDVIVDGVYMAGSVNLFIIVGGNGYVSTSANGTTWTARTGGQGTSQIYSIAINDTNDLAILTSGAGSANNASYSSNGTTWTAFSPDNGVTVARNGTMFYDAGNSKWIYARTTNEWYESTSPTSGTWTTKVSVPIASGNGNYNTTKYETNGTTFISKDSTNNKWIVITRLDAGWFTIVTIDPTVSVTTGGSQKIYKIDSVEDLRMASSSNYNSYNVSSNSALSYDSGVFVGAGNGTLEIISNV